MAIRRAKKRGFDTYTLGVMFFILLVTFLVFSLSKPTLTGFTVLDPEDVEYVELDLIETVFDEDEQIIGDLYVEVNSPMVGDSIFYAEIGDNVEEMFLVDAFDESYIDFEETEKLMKEKGSSKSKTLVFLEGEGGEQVFFFKLPAKAEIISLVKESSIKMDIQGLGDNTSYPSFVKIDLGGDGTNEWEYLGEVSNFSEDFYMPEGLDETTGTKSVIMKNKKSYYCEIIDLPRSKDFEIYVKYNFARNAKPETERDIEALILSFTGSGTSLTPQGGANSCDLEDTNSTEPKYYSCQISFDWVIEGENLVCVGNAEEGDGDKDVYELLEDGTRGDGYYCGDMMSNCKQYIGDFFIKVKKAEYTGELNRRAALSEGLTENLFDTSLSNYLEDCESLDDYCLIPLYMSSESAGMIFLDNLRIRYEYAGIPSEENNFYDVAYLPSIIHTVDGVDLTEGNVSFYLELDLLELYPPKVKKDDNYTLKAGIDPGDEDKASILIKNKNKSEIVSNISEDILGAIVYYKDLFDDLLIDYGDLLSAIDYKSKLNEAVRSLSNYKTLLDGLNKSNKMGEYNKEKIKIQGKVEDLIDDLPSYIGVSEKVSMEMIISPDDITNDVVLSHQTDDSSKKKLYILQQSVRIDTIGEVFEVTKFDREDVEGTFVIQEITSFLADSYLVSIIPSTLASSVDDIEFSVKPEVISSKNPLVLRWKMSELSGGKITYLFSVNVLNKLDKLKSVVVPKKIPEATPEDKTICGDGECTILLVDGVEIPLEDKYSCPQDCKVQVPWGSLIMVVIIFGLLIFYFGFYEGKYNFRELLKLKKKSSKGLFASAGDEKSLSSYVIASLRKGVTKEAITKNLLSRGWKKNQVDYIFRTLKK